MAKFIKPTEEVAPVVLPPDPVVMPAPAPVVAANVEVPPPDPSTPKPSYRVGNGGGIWHDFKFYAPGEEIPLTEEQAASLSHALA